MREYDDYEDQNVRLYTPVFQRVIILAAVIIAVPVVMWTITTFVRSYVARPKAPALEHLASTSAAVPVAPAASGPSAAREAPNPPAEVNKSAPTLTALSDSPASSAAANSVSTASIQTGPDHAPSPAIGAPAATASLETANATVSTASLPRSSAAPRSTDTTAASSPASSADRGISWPNPNSANPPDFAASRLPPPASPPPPSPPPARIAAAEAMPTNDAIPGLIPLPRHRPGIFVEASTTASTGSSGPVPLPRARPGGAPAETATDFAMPAGARPDLESAR